MARPFILVRLFLMDFVLVIIGFLFLAPGIFFLLRPDFAHTVESFKLILLSLCVPLDLYLADSHFSPRPTPVAFHSLDI